MVDQKPINTAGPSAELSSALEDDHVPMTVTTSPTTTSSTPQEKKKQGKNTKPTNITNAKTSKPMTGDRRQKANIVHPNQADTHVVESSKNGEFRNNEKQSNGNHRGDASSPKQTPNKIEQIPDGSESSTHDYFETFRGFLRGEKSVEKVRKRLASPKTQTGETLNFAPPRTQPPDVNGSTIPNKSTAVPLQAKTLTAFTVLRSLLIDIPMILLFACFIGSWIILGVHQQMYEPLFLRAHRTDADLMDEFTYYERQCTGLDLTTRDMKDVVVDNTTSIRDGVDIMMTHGLSIIPQVLQPDTVKALREYIVYRNEHITEDEEYPVSQGYKRISYGIEATEHPAVIAALKEVANHPIIRPLIAELLGDTDPASSEITAITNFPGCHPQGWHQDTKQDGNALKFARTYSHSYSLFLPLQDITKGMGATDVCPGTHYCANDLSSLCEKLKLGLNEATPHKVLPAGAGALLNQHVWHRGGAHTDFDAPERIVFIVSFLARPNFGVDPRQLSRGTYFHQKWNMWGHTWTDLTDPPKRMRFPFSILRCLSLWKPLDSNWGYDLITSGFMRFANGQLENDDFEGRFLPKLDQIHFPAFLRGRQVVGSQLKRWAVFIRSTIEKVHKFFAIVVLVTYLLYLFVGAGYNMYSGNPPTRWVPKPLIRLFVVNCVLALIGARLWSNIRNSTWGKHVISGRALMRPFPPKESYSFAERAIVPKGPTTMPTRWDVLIGTRFSANFLGSYRRWLDFHPGNLSFKEAIQDVGAYFNFYASMGPSVQSHIVLWVMNEIRKNEGRFLIQDFTTGDWRVLSGAETFEEVAKALKLGNSPLLDSLASKIDEMIDDRWFGPTRGQAIGSLAHLLLFEIRKSLLYRVKARLSTPQKVIKKWPTIPRSLVRLQTAHAPRALQYSERIQARTPFAAENQDDIQFGTLVWANYGEDGWLPGSILDFIPTKDWFLFSCDNSEMDSSVYYRNLKKLRLPTEGGRIMGCFQSGLENCFPGTITRVHPGGSVSIFFDDGEAESLVSPSFYYIPPFRYEGPFPV